MTRTAAAPFRDSIDDGTDERSRLGEAQDTPHPPRSQSRIRPPAPILASLNAGNDEGGLSSSHEQTLTPYLLKLSLVAGTSGLLFGWDTGICAGLLVAIKGDLGHPLSAGEQELVVSATTVGAIFGSLIAGRASDYLGRKRIILIAACLFLLGSLEQTASNDVPQLVLGRFIVGLAVGQAAAVCPMYLGEIAPSSLRGRIVGTNSLLVTGGQVIAYLVNAILFPVAHGWRWMVLASAVPAVVQLVGLLSLDESPRWLVAKGRFIQARRVLKKIYPGATEDMVENEVDRILENLKRSRQDGLLSQQVAATLRESSQDRPTTSVRRSLDSDVAETPPAHSSKATTRSKWSQLFSDPTDRRALIIASGLMFFQQACGFNSIMYYSSRLLLMAGPPFDKNPNGFASLIAITNFIGTVIAMRFVDSWGRRKLMLWTTAAMSISLALLAGSFAMIGDVGGVVDTTPPSAPSSASNGTIFPPRVATTGPSSTSSTSAPSHFWPLLSLFLMILFTLSYALGAGLIPWLILSEIFPNPSTRSLGSSLATCANWSMNLVWSASYLSFVQLLGGPAGTFGVFSVVSAMSWIFSWWGIVELRGVELEEVGRRMQQQEGGSVGNGGGSARPTSGRFANTEEHDEERERFIVSGEDEEEDEEDEGQRDVQRPRGSAERTSR
ncbi:hypothetical protein BCV69DRAFT_253510 [Microstroma glucosiphilum]|uniref:Major facilitator superfamily (MFS) profile domain-containing protein n=1 Tax=Pseudomicrostroma glucosiphilum TaxID=1684307 RepID=A0A316TWV1_9BASI|nr:hypothetical protein BCV69DRAFT_253510 [Pseudomicrostroma glucosiphilum]PWN17919.1 hypothetical protein BCV69DRAFT_253510 [Pseudomicrostroma glucosiphilum]